MSRAPIACAILLALTGVAVAGNVEAPDWVETSRKRPMPPDASRAGLVILHAEKMVEVSRSDTRTLVREAVKILTTEGRRSCRFYALQAVNESFKLVGGWRVQPDGSVTAYESKAITQVAADDRLSFSMEKVNMLAPEDARVGDVIAWEYLLKSKPEAYLQKWEFGDSRPMLLSRFGIRIPADWKLRTKLLHMSGGVDIAPSHDDAGYTFWEMRDLPALKVEPLMAPVSDLVPGLFVAYGPARDDRPDIRQFDTWESVARWYAAIAKSQVIADESIRQTASQITSGARSQLDAIRAVARFAQGLRYLNVAPGRSVAEPHPAPQILKNRFGDCEDKSVLTMALLKQVGVEAYPIIALTSDSGSVTPDFPGLYFFNHVITAVKAPEGVDLPSTIDAGPLGRLIVFDPTNTSTGVGDLPWYLQGTHAVLAHESSGRLVTLPLLPPDSSSRDSEVLVSFGPDASGIAAKASVTYAGQYAASRRDHYEETRGSKRTEEIATALSSHYGRAQVTHLDVTGVETPGDPIVVKLDVSMPLPGRDLGSMRTMATQFLLPSRAEILNEAERRTPLRIDAGYREGERMTIEIPDGWKAVTPLPSLVASSSVGDYKLDARSEGSRLLLERTLTVKAATVPAAEYGPVKKFFDDVARGDSSAVALVKSP